MLAALRCATLRRKEDLIRTWTRDDVKEFHRTHYRPDNVLLYIVGDVDVKETERVIASKFGTLDGGKIGEELEGEKREKAAKFAAETKATVKSEQSWHYPPVVHEWSDLVEGDGPSASEVSSSLQQKSKNFIIFCIIV